MNPSRRTHAGFTLIELMITVAVVAIIAAVAYPSYRKQIMKSHRADAKQALLTCAQTLERVNTQIGSYTAGTDATATAACVGATSGGYYTLPATNIPTTAAASTFTAVATPVGVQANDGCGSLTYNQDGVQAATGSEPARDCWK